MMYTIMYLLLFIVEINYVFSVCVFPNEKLYYCSLCNLNLKIQSVCYKLNNIILYIIIIIRMAGMAVV